MQVKGILFDLDGTLLDSMKIWDTIGNDYLSSLGIETEENLTETFRYMSLQQSAEYYQSVYHVKKSTDQIISEINKMVEDFYKEQAELKSGVRKILETCSKRNIKMCIATAIDRYIVDAALRIFVQMQLKRQKPIFQAHFQICSIWGREVVQ